MHLLRAKLSFLGANRFDPKGDLWVRVTFFQGSPLIEDLRQDMAQDPSQDTSQRSTEGRDSSWTDDWSFALAPKQTPRESLG